MCKFISFFHKPSTGELFFGDLNSHSATENIASNKLGISKTKFLEQWREGHYLPDGTIECRVSPDDIVSQEECNARLRFQYPTFREFFVVAYNGADKEALTSGYLDLSGCDINGITLPTTVSGYLDLRGCDLKGITLPTTVGGSLDLRGCDINGITLPKSMEIRL